jgi:predicted transcriptional regulator
MASTLAANASTNARSLSLKASRLRPRLRADAPMMAPAYAEQRSTLASKVGLGRKPASAPAAPEPKTAAAQRPVRVGGRRKSA